MVRQIKPTLYFEPNGGFHEASVEFRIRGSRLRPDRCRNHIIAFAFTFGRPVRFYHGFGVGEKISGRWRREQASGRLKRNGGQRAVVLAMPRRLYVRATKAIVIAKPRQEAIFQ